jgi:hypothetical protein
MKKIVHHGYTVIGTARATSGSWQPHAHVVSREQQRKVKLKAEDYFTTKGEAEENALRLGKHWVNNHLQSLQPLP